MQVCVGDSCTKSLLLEQQRFGGDRAHATWAEEFCNGDKQVDRQEEQTVHERKRITPTVVRDYTERINSLSLRIRHRQDVISAQQHMPIQAIRINASAFVRHRD